MAKKKIGRPSYPITMVLVGANVDGRANFMAVGWFSMMNTDPPIIGVSIGRGRHTLEGILENGTFSVNIVSLEMTERADYCGMVSGKDVDKSKLFEVTYRELATAPLIEESPLYMECRMNDTIELDDHVWIMAEVTGVYVEEDLMRDGSMDNEKVAPLLLTIPDRNHWSRGGPEAPRRTIIERTR